MKRLASVCVICLGTVAAAALAQDLPAKTGAPIVTAKADPKIAAAIAQISPAKVHDDIEKLVSFKNRSTLSSMDTDLPPGTGVTAAADWIFSEFTSISEACGGCLEVKRDDFIEPASHAPQARITRDTRLQNIYAVLKGTDPAQADRRVLRVLGTDLPYRGGPVTGSGPAALGE